MGWVSPVPKPEGVSPGVGEKRGQKSEIDLQVARDGIRILLPTSVGSKTLPDMYHQGKQDLRQHLRCPGAAESCSQD